MGHKKVTYSLQILKALIDSPNSCVYCIENCERSLTILPVHLDNIKHSVNELLRNKVTTYDAVLKGIILGHKDIRVVNHVQLNDDGNFGLDYVADIYIFKPQVGKLLSGEVNKKSKDHIGVLVHSFFNVSIPRPRNDAKCPKNWIGFETSVGQTVTFEVVKLNFTGRLPYFKGKLMDVSETDYEDKDSGIGGHESMEENGTSKDEMETSSTEFIGNSMKKKKKKKKKHKSSETLEHGCEEDSKMEFSVDETEEVLVAEDALLKEIDQDRIEGHSEKKKKKKREKKYSDSECLDFSTSSHTPECSFETIKEPKKSKKRKHSELDESSSTEPSFSLNTDEVAVKTQKKKKKKKHKLSETLEHGCEEGSKMEFSVDKTEEVFVAEDALLKEIDEDQMERHSEKKRREKKYSDSKSLDFSTSLPTPECSVKTIKEPKKSKKRKHSEQDESSSTEPSFSLNTDEVAVKTPKKKKKKKHSDSSWMNSDCQEQEIVS